MPHNLFNSLQTFTTAAGKTSRLYSLPQLEKEGVGPISRLPISIRIVLESVLRNYDGQKITADDVRTLANWGPTETRTAEIPFVVARIILQDFTGVPLLVDLAAMRSAVAQLGKDPKTVEPLVPVDLVIDHSIQVDHSGAANALQRNMEIEFERNRPRYQFLKWGMQAFESFQVVPPGIGIVHQVNLEYLAKGVLSRDGVSYPDTLVGTDSHTTMINGLGVVAWGVGGIEAEAGMLGQPVYFLMPDVVGMHLTGNLGEGVTATDLVLHCTEMLRQAKVVGKFVEYFGDGATALALTDRATLANMAPEYGATMGFFPVDEETCTYLSATGRTDEQVDAFRSYFQAQHMFGIPRRGEVAYSQVIELNLADVQPSLAGPRRPQDRINLPDIKGRFRDLLTMPLHAGGFNTDQHTLDQRYAIQNGADTDLGDIGHGDVLIAAITSCTNTSNPSVMLAAGLLAKKAVQRGLRVKPTVKTSLGPGSRVVTEYLEKTGLQEYLNQVGFQTVGYGCTTCIGNSGPLNPAIEETVTQNNIVAASVLSGNRNFEARIHQNIRANFLMSPPLVVSFALAGRVDIDLAKEPLGQDKDGSDVYLRDLWPSMSEIQDLMSSALDPETYRSLYTNFEDHNPLWNDIPSSTGTVYEWDAESTYIQEPPFFESFDLQPGTIQGISRARPLALLGDSVTTDHISPAGTIKPDSPAGIYLQGRGVKVKDFNSYGSRRGNDHIMTRGTFANVRIKNLMLPGVEGGETLYHPDNGSSGEQMAIQMSIYDAAMKYQADGIPLMVLAGQEYGTGSSRDWAAKGTRLLGVKAVVAQSFERIHRSNLVLMGVVPCQFKDGTSVQSLNLDGSETFDLVGLDNDLQPRQDASLVVHRENGQTEEVRVTVRIDTPIEVEYYRHGGILPYILRQLVA